jgi:hypothetical protein
MTRFQEYKYLKLPGRLIYRAYEYSFDFEVGLESELTKRAGSQGTTSLLLDTLQIEIGVETGTVLFVWGLHPHTKWVKERLAPFSARPGSVRVLLDRLPTVGVSESLKDISQVRTTYDPNTGWIRISPGQDLSEDYIEFADNTVIGLANEKLTSLWLRPIWSRVSFEEQAPSPLFDSDNHLV